MSLELKRRKGSKHWYIRGTVRGQSIFETTGTDDKTAAEAIRIKREARLLEDSIHGKKASVTFAEAAASYLSSGGSRRYFGQQKDDGTWTGLIGYFYAKKLHAIGQSDLDQSAAKLYPTATAETRNRQCYTPFIAVWNHAVKNQWADLRKWSRPRKSKGIAQRIRPLRSGQRPVSYELAAQFVLAMSPAPAFVMTALFYTGMRPSELLALDASIDDIRPRDNWLVLASSKTGEPRGVPLHDFVVPLFTALVERGGRLFRTPRGEPYPLTEDADDHVSGQLKTAILGARRRSGINDVSPYTARHTVSTQLVINGVHPYIKDQILGHAVDDMSRHYTHVPQPELIAAINTLPIIPAWAGAPWWNNPVSWQRKLAEGTGARSDLRRTA